MAVGMMGSNATILALIIQAVITAIPPTLAAIAALIAAIRGNRTSEKQLETISDDIAEVRQTVVNHVTDRSVHRGRPRI